ncbi:hypothetical protein BLNAU_16994 [Blattamonas nauphoetae]|uniref:Right handed beta helix domain-containing protein n=1 Tax=Blattamonas nauphoetae TaxID=2049346 RepID=A0ABQ9X9X8_9EUKA|nr:hypothetical protein BLNAU_16994 [Blattamonas nauphoetae]
MSEAARKTSLISTQLECVVDPFYGSIVAHINSGGEFLFSNSSFHSIVGNTVSDITCSTEGCATHQGLFSTQSFTVSTCIFNGCSSTTSGGAFRYAFTDGIFTCEDCSFTDCLAEVDGGGFELQEHAKSTIARNTFTNCHAEAFGGGIVVNSGTESVSITDCSFVDCQGSDGSGLHRNTAGLSTIISGLKFDGCEALCGQSFNQIGSAGSLFLHLDRTTQMFNCSVKNTRLGIDGAAISCRPTTTYIFSAYDLLIEGSIPQRPDWMEEERYTSRMADIGIELPASTVTPPPITVTTHGLFINMPLQTSERTSSISVAFTPAADSTLDPPFKTSTMLIPENFTSPLFAVPTSTKIIREWLAFLEMNLQHCTMTW